MLPDRRQSCSKEGKWNTGAVTMLKCSSYTIEADQSLSELALLRFSMCTLGCSLICIETASRDRATSWETLLKPVIQLASSISFIHSTMFVSLVLLWICMSFFVLCLKCQRPKNFPPGPPPLPILGNLLSLSLDNPMRDFERVRAPLKRDSLPLPLIVYTYY